MVIAPPLRNILVAVFDINFALLNMNVVKVGYILPARKRLIVINPVRVKLTLHI